MIAATLSGRGEPSSSTAPPPPPPPPPLPPPQPTPPPSTATSTPAALPGDSMPEVAFSPHSAASAAGQAVPERTHIDLISPPPQGSGGDESHGFSPDSTPAGAIAAPRSAPASAPGVERESSVPASNPVPADAADCAVGQQEPLEQVLVHQRQQASSAAAAALQQGSSRRRSPRHAHRSIDFDASADRATRRREWLDFDASADRATRRRERSPPSSRAAASVRAADGLSTSVAPPPPPPPPQCSQGVRFTSRAAPGFSPESTPTGASAAAAITPGSAPSAAPGPSVLASSSDLAYEEADAAERRRGISPLRRSPRRSPRLSVQRSGLHEGSPANQRRSPRLVRQEQDRSARRRGFSPGLTPDRATLQRDHEAFLAELRRREAATAAPAPTSFVHPRPSTSLSRFHTEVRQQEAARALAAREKEAARVSAARASGASTSSARPREGSASDDRSTRQRRSPRLDQQEMDRRQALRQRAFSVLQAMVDLSRADPQLLDWERFPVPDKGQYHGRRQHTTSLRLIESRVSTKVWYSKITTTGREFRGLFQEGASYVGQDKFLHMVHGRFMQEKLRERDEADAAEEAAFAAALANPNPVVGVDDDSDESM